MAANQTHEAAAATSAPPHPIGRYRWTVCALLFFATTINYLDRQVIGILKPELSLRLNWSEVDYGHIVMAFQATYALGLVTAGGLMDRVGTRLGYAAALAVWSLAAVGHAFARTAFGFGVARAALGIGEAGNFPAAVKTVAEWFPRSERALATGIFNAGAGVGAVVAPLSVPFIAIHYGWRWAFILTWAVGLIWLLFWLPLYRRPEEQPRLTAGELAFIRRDAPEPVARTPWLRLLPLRQTWAIATAKFLTDPVWWFYLYWLADFLKKKYGIGLAHVSLPLVAIYLFADFGSVGGGWLSSRLIQRGWDTNAGRKTTLLVCALCVVPVTFAVSATHLWVAVGLIGLAAAAHQGWSANVYTLASDLFPRQAVGSVTGIAATAGALGGLLAAWGVSHVLQWTHSDYRPIFLVCGLAYLLALGLVHLLSPRLTPVDLGG